MRRGHDVHRMLERSFSEGAERRRDVTVTSDDNPVWHLIRIDDVHIAWTWCHKLYDLSESLTFVREGAEQPPTCVTCIATRAFVEDDGL
jgi:hypothetical protein